MDNLQEKIEVVIPYEGNPATTEKYIDSYNCYLAEALKKLGYTDFVVGPIGDIEDADSLALLYRPSKNTPFSLCALRHAFNNGHDLTITLISTRKEFQEKVAKSK